jgi:hypothetical protein
VDRDAGLLWLDPPRGRSLQGSLTTPQLADLRAALTALHATGIAHGHVDRMHVLIDEDGAALLRFAPYCDATATVDRDRLALVRLAE